MVFYCLFFILALLGYKGLSSNKLGKQSVNLIAILFILIGAFRYDVGADWGSYIDTYKTIAESSSFQISDVIREPIFYFLEFAISRVFKSPVFFISIVFVISFLLKFEFLKKNQGLNIFIALIVYLSGIFLIFDINGIRQGLAMGLALYSTTCIFERKPIKFIVIISCASLFHTSALIFSFAYLLCFIKKSFSTPQYIIFSIIAIILGITLSELVPNYLSLALGDEGANHFSYYAEGNNGYTTKVTIWGMASVRRYLLWLFILYFLRDNKSKEVSFYKNCMVASFFLFFLMSDSMEVSYRLSYYYSMFELVLIPLAISNIKNVSNQKFFYVVIVLVYFYLTYKLVDNPVGQLNEYHSVFFHN